MYDGLQPLYFRSRRAKQLFMIILAQCATAALLARAIGYGCRRHCHLQRSYCACLSVYPPMIPQNFLFFRWSMATRDIETHLVSAFASAAEQRAEAERSRRAQAVGLSTENACAECCVSRGGGIAMYKALLQVPGVDLPNIGGAARRHPWLRAGPHQKFAGWQEQRPPRRYQSAGSYVALVHVLEPQSVTNITRMLGRILAMSGQASSRC